MRKGGGYRADEAGGGALAYALVFAVLAGAIILVLRAHPPGAGAGQGDLIGGATAAFSGLGQSIGDSIGRSSAF